LRALTVPTDTGTSAAVNATTKQSDKLIKRAMDFISFERFYDRPNTREAKIKKRDENRPALVTQLKLWFENRPQGPDLQKFPAAKNRRRYFFLAAVFFLATALTGFFDAGDFVDFLAMLINSTNFFQMARKFFHVVADLFRNNAALPTAQTCCRKQPRSTPRLYCFKDAQKRAMRVTPF
jgi:hypothetical protein